MHHQIKCPLFLKNMGRYLKYRLKYIQIFEKLERKRVLRQNYQKKGTIFIVIIPNKNHKKILKLPKF